jgi:hypothetical protein
MPPTSVAPAGLAGTSQPDAHLQDPAILRKLPPTARRTPAASPGPATEPGGIAAMPPTSVAAGRLVGTSQPDAHPQDPAILRKPPPTARASLAHPWRIPRPGDRTRGHCRWAPHFGRPGRLAGTSRGGRGGLVRIEPRHRLHERNARAPVGDLAARSQTRTVAPFDPTSEAPPSQPRAPACSLSTWPRSKPSS